MKVSVATPVGSICLEANETSIIGIGWDEGPPVTDQTPDVLADAARQLLGYFKGSVTRFDVPLSLGPGTFQVRFQKALLDIPFGDTRTYGQLAKDLGVSAQAIGQACGANRLPVIVPCHRVVGANGLGGFSGGVGVETKVALLKHEGAASLLI